MTDNQPCDRTDLPEDPDMHCGCGFEAGEHPAWLRRIERRRAEREAPGFFQQVPADVEWQTSELVPDPTEASAAFLRKVLGAPDTASGIAGLGDHERSPPDAFVAPWCFNVPSVPDRVTAFRDESGRVWLRLAGDQWALADWDPEYIRWCEKHAAEGHKTGYPLVDVLDSAPLVECEDPRGAR